MISGKNNYHEIDTIRFITISIIVWTHSLFPAWHIRRSDILSEQIVQSVVIQLGAISTIIFFIISGILMHSKLHQYTLKKYFIERIPAVYGPWLFFIALNIVLLMVHQIYFGELKPAASASPIVASIYVIVNGLVIYGPYWFVLTYLVGMVVLIWFKQYSSNIYFGVLLAVMTAFYAVNFYFSWIDSFHTKAVLAYTFFIWIGFQIHKHWQVILDKVKNTRWFVFIILMLVFFSIACYDGYKLSLNDVRDPFASNRFANIIFSIIFFFFLVKVGPISMINKLQPRKIVYGIYLVNSVVILELSMLFRSYVDELNLVDIWYLLGLQFIFFIVTLVLTYTIVNYLINSSLRWIIGSN